MALAPEESTEKFKPHTVLHLTNLFILSTKQFSLLDKNVLDVAWGTHPAIQQGIPASTSVPSWPLHATILSSRQDIPRTLR